MKGTVLAELRGRGLNLARYVGSRGRFATRGSADLARADLFVDHLG